MRNLEKFIRAFMSLVKSEIDVNSPHSLADSFFTEKFLQGLFILSESHDIAHIVGNALLKLDVIKKIDKEKEPTKAAIIDKFKRQIFIAVFRDENLRFELDNLCKIFEDNNIDFIPLKGSVLSALYPLSWIRTRGDIDILIHKEDIERATKILVENHGYTKKHLSNHDVNFLTPAKMHFELHFDLIENDQLNEREKILHGIWDYAVLEENKKHKYYLKDEMFYYYHVAHTAKHFAMCGCGIRHFMDTWILANKVDFDIEKRYELLEKGGLLTFAKSCEKLTNVWFCQEEYDELSLQVERYILQSGVFGTLTNLLVVQQIKRGGRIRHIISRLWMPYEKISVYYPVLKKHKYLLPIFQVVRWSRLIFKKRLAHTKKELDVGKTITEKNREDVHIMLKNLELY